MGLLVPFAIRNRREQLGNVLNCCWEDRVASWNLCQMSFILNLRVHSNPITAKFIDCDVRWLDTHTKKLYMVLSARFYAWLQETPLPTSCLLFIFLLCEPRLQGCALWSLASIYRFFFSCFFLTALVPKAYHSCYYFSTLTSLIYFHIKKGIYLSNRIDINVV